MRLRLVLNITFAAILVISFAATLSSFFNTKKSLDDLRTVVKHHVPSLHLLFLSYNQLNDTRVSYDLFADSDYITPGEIATYLHRLKATAVKLQKSVSAPVGYFPEVTQLLDRLSALTTKRNLFKQGETALWFEEFQKTKAESRKILLQLREGLPQVATVQQEATMDEGFAEMYRNYSKLLFMTTDIIDAFYAQNFHPLKNVLKQIRSCKESLKELLVISAQFGEIYQAKGQVEDILSSLNRYISAIILFDDEKKLGVSGANLEEISNAVKQAQDDATESFQQFNDAILASINTAQMKIISANLQLRQIFIASSIAGVFAVAVLLFLFKRAFTKNVNSLVSGAEKIANGDLLYRLKLGSIDDYLTPLTVAFNAMADTLQKREKEKEIHLEQLNKAQKMEAIGLMAGGVAHDLNNILSGVVSYPDLLLMRLPEDSDLRKPLETIKQSGLRATDIISDLLTFAKGAATVKEVRDLHALINEYLDSPEHKKLFERFPLVRFEQHYSSEPIYIYCSEIHVKKCLMNLIFNAYEAIQDQSEGVCTIETQKTVVDKDESQLLQITAGEYVSLQICDTGYGISATDVPHVFEPFYTKKKMGRSGTGLGLSIVYSSMREHFGTVSVQSSDQGTCFTLYYPVCEYEPAHDFTEAAPEDLRSTEGESILVIDDEATLREVASQIFKTLGYEVHVVPSGEEAIEFLLRHHVDLVLLDMSMEPGISGLETYQRIIQHNPGQKAIIASGYAEEELVDKALQLGVGGFVSKPYSIVKIGLAVKEELHGSHYRVARRK
ncbi:MAG: response regulator [Desulfobulbaceae bacterium]|nr:response regulator [Desulfobulbaceae bacterium]